MSDRQKLFLALLASAVIHVAFGLILNSWRNGQTATDTPKPDLSQLTVTIMPKAPPTPTPKPLLAAAPTPTPPIVRPELDSDGLTRSTKAPEHALFQSDANMVAGSLLPAAGDVPVPTEAGPQRKFDEFADLAASVGKGQTPLQPTRPQPAQAASMPEQTPFAVTHVQNSASPPPTPPPTPPPNTIAIGTPTPTPAPTPELLAKLAAPPTLRANADIAPMNEPLPPSPPQPVQPPAEPSTQRQMEKTRIKGGITAPGGPAVDAVETPYGRYEARLMNLIGSRWDLYNEEHPKDVGDVTIRVMLYPNGRVASTRVVANNSIDDLADLSTRAIMESTLPPVPDDLAPMLHDGKLEVNLTFAIYDSTNDPSGR
jgi:hypothetical protein